MLFRSGSQQNRKSRKDRRPSGPKSAIAMGSRNSLSWWRMWNLLALVGELRQLHLARRPNILVSNTKSLNRVIATIAIALIKLDPVC